MIENTQIQVSQKKVTNNCAVLGCSSKLSRVNNKAGLCFRHGEWLQFLLWALPKITIDKKPDLGLWTPESKVE